MDSPRSRSTDPSAWRFCVAPMMDWTDRHCRYFHRLLTRHARLYTEMITAPALAHGDVPHHLDFDAAEQPVALQLGGSEPAALAHAARLGAAWGYAEINLNCGCPSERVQTGSFGACLMAEPELVARCVSAMRAVVDVPVTVKHRIGLDASDDYGFVRDFVGTVAQAGCDVFVVHARNAVLKGLSPRENREIPPLRYAVVRRLRQDFPGCIFVLNGGLDRLDAVDRELAAVDGVMLGRTAYHDPWMLTGVDAQLHDDWHERPTRAGVVRRMAAYAQHQVARGVPLRAITRHMLGLYHAQPGGRRFRQRLSDSRALARNDPALLVEALADTEPASAEPVW